MERATNTACAVRLVFGFEKALSSACVVRLVVLVVEENIVVFFATLAVAEVEGKMQELSCWTFSYLCLFCQLLVSG